MQDSEPILELTERLPLAFRRVHVTRIAPRELEQRLEIHDARQASVMILPRSAGKPISKILPPR